MLSAPAQKYSGGQHFKTLTAAHFRLFLFSYLFSILAELDIPCRFFLAHSDEKLLDAEWNIALRRVADYGVYPQIFRNGGPAMVNRKSDYALNKKDITAIVYIDADKHIIRLTREDFSGEEVLR